MSKKIKLIFTGTSDFGLPSLKSIIKDKDFDISLVVTQPDKKFGRKQVLSPSPIKTVALDNKLIILQPVNIKSITKEIKDIKPDIMLVVAYAQIIPAWKTSASRGSETMALPW